MVTVFQTKDDKGFGLLFVLPEGTGAPKSWALVRGSDKAMLSASGFGKGAQLLPFVAYKGAGTGATALHLEPALAKHVDLSSAMLRLEYDDADPTLLRFRIPSTPALWQAPEPVAGEEVDLTEDEPEVDKADDLGKKADSQEVIADDPVKPDAKPEDTQKQTDEKRDEKIDKPDPKPFPFAKVASMVLALCLVAGLVWLFVAEKDDVAELPKEKEQTEPVVVPEPEIVQTKTDVCDNRQTPTAALLKSGPVICPDRPLSDPASDGSLMILPLLNDYAAKGELKLIGCDAPQNGRVFVSGQMVVYRPNPALARAQSQTDRFECEVSDDTEQTVRSSVDIELAPFGMFEVEAFSDVEALPAASALADEHQLVWLMDGSFRSVVYADNLPQGDTQTLTPLNPRRVAALAKVDANGQLSELAFGSGLTLGFGLDVTPRVLALPEKGILGLSVGANVTGGPNLVTVFRTPSSFVRYLLRRRVSSAIDFRIVARASDAIVSIPTPFFQ